MKKILVVAAEVYFREAMTVAIQSLRGEVEIIASSHEEAMEKFLLEEPRVAIICDYHEEIKNSPILPGKQTYQDLKMSTTDEKIFRCGLDSYGYEDYIKIPCEIEELQKILK